MRGGEPRLSYLGKRLSPVSQILSVDESFGHEAIVDILAVCSFGRSFL